MAYQTVIYEKKGKIAYVTLNRPASGNARNGQMDRELREIWEDFKKDNEIWVGIITGAGERHFCTGVDMKEMSAGGKQAKEAHRWQELGAPRQALGYPGEHDIWKPLILAINGTCIGGAFHFVCDTDIAICSENATFFIPHVSYGWVEAEGLIGLSRRIPLGQVLRMGLMGAHERMDAQRAYQIGLVSQMVPLKELLPTATRIAETILRNSPIAVRETKNVVRKGLDVGFREAVELGNYIERGLMEYPDQIEGPRAFAEKREPVWRTK